MMTNEEARFYVRQTLSKHGHNFTNDQTEALYKALRALEDVPMAEWHYTELTESISGGGSLTKRGYRCSNCGGFRHKRQGKSEYCEFCGRKMRGDEP